MSRIVTRYEMNTEGERIEIIEGSFEQADNSIEFRITEVGDERTLATWLDADEIDSLVDVLMSLSTRLRNKADKVRV